jgi:ribulose bisphosphate carboxylase small subunit
MCEFMVSIPLRNAVFPQWLFSVLESPWPAMLVQYPLPVSLLLIRCLFANLPVTSAGNGFAGAQGLSPDLVQQVSQLVNQGYRISLEHADQRRYRSGAWQTIAPLDGRNNVSRVLSELESDCEEHRGEYVRLLGIDPRSKTARFRNDDSASLGRFSSLAFHANGKTSSELILPRAILCAW